MSQDNICVQIIEANIKVAEKTKIYVPYNILPLDPESSNQAIMRYPEVSATFSCACFKYSCAIVISQVVGLGLKS